MNALVQAVPPGRLWVEVTDLPSALLALELLREAARSSPEPSAAEAGDQV